MKDYNGDEIKVGDKVIFIMAYYRDLVEGTVYKITPKKVRINNIFPLGRPNAETIRFGSQVVLKRK